jgi:hypothetical protein
VTWCSDVMMSAGGEVAPRKGKEGDDGGWADANLTRSKNEENTHINSAGSNRW